MFEDPTHAGASIDPRALVDTLREVIQDTAAGRNHIFAPPFGAFFTAIG
jgi:hypothetical protein